jgi:hypothetical protein
MIAIIAVKLYNDPDSIMTQKKTQKNRGRRCSADIVEGVDRTLKEIKSDPMHCTAIDAASVIVVC